MSRNLYITGTRRGDGKTTITVGLTQAIKTKVPNLGFIKPLGSRDIERTGYSLDHDTLLVHKACDVHGSIQDANPITIDRGFPSYALTQARGTDLLKQIEEAFQRVQAGRDLVIIEGAGHAAVGSMFGISNALVAQRLGAKVLLVASGKDGHPFDEIALSLAFFEKHGAEILGVVLNQIPYPNLKEVRDVTATMLARHGIKVVGALPKLRLFTSPKLVEILEALEGRALSCREKVNNRYRRILLGAMTAASAFPRLFHVGEEVLLITPGDRVDIVLAALQAHQTIAAEGRHLLAGIVLTGGLVPDPGTIEILGKTGIPTLAVEADSFQAASRIHDMEPALSPNDRRVLKILHQAANKYIDIETLLERLG
ncbi:MAG: AAA family ATPase [Planctomycetes bacterium]|nr:AAA family ATPase [Planctomycetota bacterium]